MNIGSVELKCNPHIKQHIQVCSDYEKRGRLRAVMERHMDGSRILVFTGTKRVADELTRDMRRDGFPALAIHGDKTQPERDWVLAEFKSGRAPLMVATDVAARGLDVAGIKVCVCARACSFALVRMCMNVCVSA